MSLASRRIKRLRPDKHRIARARLRSPLILDPFLDLAPVPPGVAVDPVDRQGEVLRRVSPQPFEAVAGHVELRQEEGSANQKGLGLAASASQRSLSSRTKRASRLDRSPAICASISSRSQRVASSAGAKSACCLASSTAGSPLWTLSGGG